MRSEGCTEPACIVIWIYVVACNALVAVSIWLCVSQDAIISQMSTLLAPQNSANANTLAQYVVSNNYSLFVGAYISITVGLFLNFVEFVGYRRRLNMLIILSGTSFILAFVAGVIEINYQNLLSSEIVQQFISLQQQFDGLYNSSNSLSQGWYQLMQWSQCCGVGGATDFGINSTSASLWFQNNQTTCANNWCYTNATVPSSCCQQYPNGTLLDQTCVTLGTPTYMFNNSCQSTALTQIQSTLFTRSTLILGISYGFASICLLTIITTPVLYNEHCTCG